MPIITREEGRQIHDELYSTEPVYAIKRLAEEASRRAHQAASGSAPPSLDTATRDLHRMTQNAQRKSNDYLKVAAQALLVAYLIASQPNDKTPH